MRRDAKGPVYMLYVCRMRGIWMAFVLFQCACTARVSSRVHQPFSLVSEIHITMPGNENAYIPATVLHDGRYWA